MITNFSFIPPNYQKSSPATGGGANNSEKYTPLNEKPMEEYIFKKLFYIFLLNFEAKMHKFAEKVDQKRGIIFIYISKILTKINLLKF